MAHQVNINLPEREIGNSDVTFEVTKNGKPFGKLRVSKGGVDWISAPSRTPIKKTWTGFDKVLRAARESAKKRSAKT